MEAILQHFCFVIKQPSRSSFSKECHLYLYLYQNLLAISWYITISRCTCGGKNGKSLDLLLLLLLVAIELQQVKIEDNLL